MKKVLIIEDEESLKKALSDKLIKEGFEVLEASEGETGLNIALIKHPDLIVLDIIMPKMDGFVMLEKLRLDDWGKGVKVILLTNLNSQEYVLKSFRNEVYDFIVKSDTKIDTVVEKIKNKLL